MPVCLLGSKCSGSKGLKTGVFCWCLGGLSNASRAPGIPSAKDVFRYGRIPQLLPFPLREDLIDNLDNLIPTQSMKSCRLRINLWGHQISQNTNQNIVRISALASIIGGIKRTMTFYYNRQALINTD